MVNGKIKVIKLNEIDDCRRRNYKRMPMTLCPTRFRHTHEDRNRAALDSHMDMLTRFDLDGIAACIKVLDNAKIRYD